MDTLESVQLFVAFNLFIIGLSHFLQPRMWIEFFVVLHRQGSTGNIFNALLSMGVGAFILAFHWVWTGPLMLVTLYGVAQLFKGTLYLLFPSIGLRSLSKVNDRLEGFKGVGLVMSLLGGILFYHLIASGALN